MRNRGDLDVVQPLLSTSYSIKSIISSISVKILKQRAAMKSKIYSILVRASAKGRITFIKPGLLSEEKQQKEMSPKA